MPTLHGLQKLFPWSKHLFFPFSMNDLKDLIIVLNIIVLVQAQHSLIPFPSPVASSPQHCLLSLMGRAHAQTISISLHGHTCSASDVDSCRSNSSVQSKAYSMLVTSNHPLGPTHCNYFRCCMLVLGCWGEHQPRDSSWRQNDCQALTAFPTGRS